MGVGVITGVGVKKVGGGGRIGDTIGVTVSGFFRSQYEISK